MIGLLITWIVYIWNKAQIKSGWKNVIFKKPKVIFTIFFCMWAFGAIYSFIENYRLGLTFKKGNFKIVEGKVENYRLERFKEDTDFPHGAERFTVSGIPFDYSDNTVINGFHQTAVQGGPIKEGLIVRISYLPYSELNNRIIKLEIDDNMNNLINQ